MHNLLKSSDMHLRSIRFLLFSKSWLKWKSNYLKSNKRTYRKKNCLPPKHALQEDRKSTRKAKLKWKALVNLTKKPTLYYGVIKSFTQLRYQYLTNSVNFKAFYQALLYLWKGFKQVTSTTIHWKERNVHAAPYSGWREIISMCPVANYLPRL